MSLQNCRTLINFLTAATLILIAASCHSSKKAVSSNSIKPSRPKTEKVSDMKRDVAKREYDIEQIKDLISEAAKWLGTPYKYARQSRDGTDCSGMIVEIYKKVFDEKLPRNSGEQQKYCKKIDRGNIQPGDLLFFATGKNSKRVSHVGLYIGNGDMIHASTSRGVIISNIGERYYDSRFHSAGRSPSVDKLYATNGKNGGKGEKNTSDATIQVALSERRPEAIDSVTVDQLLLSPLNGKPHPVDALDGMITEKIDSIFTDFLD